MEHRCSPRKSAEYHVMFYQHGQAIQSGCIKNISMGGVFVEVPAGRWRRHEAFEMELVSQRGAKLRLPAQLVHMHSNGVGVMFDSMNSEQKKMLRDVFYIGCEQHKSQSNKAGMTAA